MYITLHEVEGYPRPDEGVLLVVRGPFVEPAVRVEQKCIVPPEIGSALQVEQGDCNLVQLGFSACVMSPSS